MNNAMHLSFQLKVAKKNEFGKAPVYARITINEARTEFSLKQYIEPEKWVGKAGYAKGHSDEIKSLNNHLASVRAKLLQHYNKLFESGKNVTANAVKDSYFGISEKDKTVLEIFKYHNDQMKSLVGKEYSQGTYERYCTALNHTEDFLKHRYRVPDLSINQVNHEFIIEYEYFLKAICRCSHNSTIKYLTNFKKIMRICLGNGWLDKDPFINYRFQLKEVEREILHEHEIEAITIKKFGTMRLEQVRDIFLFCCYTGLSYSDVKKLNNENLIVGIDGQRWIKVNRTKTDTRSNIPILPTAQTILAKYENDPKCNSGKTLLPVSTNQKMNEYLKEIAAICGIDKNITFHMARHSFATTITLQNDVPIESISKMLGHKSIRTTQHYAKVLDKKVCNDMAILKTKLNETIGGKTKIA